MSHNKNNRVRVKLAGYTKKDRAKADLKNFGKAFFLAPYTAEDQPPKNEFGHRAFIAGAVIGFPVWFSLAFIINITADVTVCTFRALVDDSSLGI